MSREEIEDISTDFLAKKNYILKSKKLDQLVYNGGRDINNTILVLAFLLFIFGGVLYYILSKKHTITVRLLETVNGLNVIVDGNTDLSSSIAKDFQDTLVLFNTRTATVGYRIQEIKCPKCGSSLDYTGEGTFVECDFCGTNLSISELKE